MKLQFLSPLKYAVIAVLLIFFPSCEKNEVGEKSSGLADNSARFSDNEHIISEEQAAVYIQRFRTAYPTMNTDCYWTKHALYQILAQPFTANVRYYFGQSENNKPQLFLLGADERDNDIITGNIIGASSADGLVTRLPNTEVNWQDAQAVELNAAASSTARHRKTFPNVTLAGTFDKEAIQLLLIKNPVFGVLVQYGLTEDNDWVIIIRSLGKNGQVIPGFIIERAQRCPPICGNGNILNGGL